MGASGRAREEGERHQGKDMGRVVAGEDQPPGLVHPARDGRFGPTDHVAVAFRRHDADGTAGLDPFGVGHDIHPFVTEEARAGGAQIGGRDPHGAVQVAAPHRRRVARLPPVSSPRKIPRRVRRRFFGRRWIRTHELISTRNTVAASTLLARAKSAATGIPPRRDR
jgi:hypothetical protein